MGKIVLSEYERRVLFFINGDVLGGALIVPGAALWNCLERLQALGFVHKTFKGQYLTQEWKLTERGKELVEGVWMA